MRIRKKSPVDAALKDEEIVQAAKIADALAHPARIKILRFILLENLARREVTNKDIVLAFDYAQATISQHLSKLIIGGLVKTQKKGTCSYYFARVGRLSSFTEILKKIEPRAGAEGAPDFLLAPQRAPDSAEHTAPEELHPEDLNPRADEEYDDRPRFL